ncbi:adenosylcobinamide amidohydrolase [Thalassococcus sp. S3]|uniref:adenosylcobinamide amidohydrolase n=1 Tax=Thalassococcus sp. S3 TaxID=2017482 RepID=UPI0010241640|nr:adenosylcobinamide amidohydrolase [Thalassococcus sp. S3]QBF30194.1 adenosylcobinamide amidohydrolase [Thalassococcus sp. S3]
MTPERVHLDRPWLSFDLGSRVRVLSWTLNRPGIVTANRIVWREVRNANLPEELDVHEWLNRELSARGEEESVAFLTSRAIDRFHCAGAQIGSANAFAVATVGLSNAERVGHRQPPHPFAYGTINIAAQLDTGLTEAGLIEAMSIVVQARTAAILDANVPLVSGQATGTGTDCVAVAVPPGEAAYAGLHTEIGEALGRAVYDAVSAGAADWKAEQEVSEDA